MTYAINKISQVLLALLTLVLSLHAQDQPTESPVRDDSWRNKELQRAQKLIRGQHDFSPIHEAFAAKDIVLLWHYYTLSFEIPMHRYLGKGSPLSDEAVAKLPPERQQRIKVNREIYKLARDYLLQIPGHARRIGNRIEEITRRPTIEYRPTLFSCLSSLGQDGSDECIEQLGRFLFDPRDPGFRPKDPAEPLVSEYDTRGMRNPVQNDAAGAMRGAVQGRFAFAKTLLDENSKPFKNMPVKDSADRVRNWWLTSEEAAPYRRSLAATGVVLPPGYPPMKELEGTKTTIAPPLKNPPYPDGEAKPPPPVKP